MVFVKKLRFFPIFFFTKIDQEKLFCEVIKGKEAFLYYKHIGLRNPQLCLFRKG